MEGKETDTASDSGSIRNGNATMRKGLFRMKQCKRMWTTLLILSVITGILNCAGPGVQRKPDALGQTSSGVGADKGTRPAEAALPQSAAAPSQKSSEVRSPAPKETATKPVVPLVGAPGPGPSAPRPGEPVKAGARFVLNFDNADLYEVIRVMSEMMKISYVVDPRVKGVVNIHTTGHISTEEVFPIFQGILKLNGATAVKKGNIYEIVPFGEAKKSHASPSRSKDFTKMEEERYTIQIIPLKFVPVSEVSKMLKPFLSDGADLVEHPPSNLLIIGDIATNVRKSLGIIEMFDVDIFADMRVRLYPIIHADVNEIAKEMERIFSSFEVSVKSGRGVGITFTPITRINTLLVVSSIPSIFDKVDAWLKELDRVPGAGTQMSVFVYYVQNGKAKDLAEVLKQVYVPTKKQEGKSASTGAPAPSTPAGVLPPSQQRTVRPAPATPPASDSHAAPAGAAGIPEGDINIVVDETTNALLIRAFQRDYIFILETIKKLDLYPKQALIEVLLAEVTLDDSYRYGLEFSTFNDSFKQGQYPYSIGAGGTPFLGMPRDDAALKAFSSGLRYAISSTKLVGAIHAAASANNLKVISSPHLLASNNKEARIQIGKSQPVLTNTYTTTATGTPGVVEGSIEYKDIGIIMTITPRISDGGLVSLDINVEKSDVDNTSLGNLSSIPFFSKKTAKTTLSIMEGQTIVIGGLIEDQKNTSSSGLPFLSKIPILGALFGFQTYGKVKTETLLLLTPHVIANLEQSNAVTHDFRRQIREMKQELEKRDRDRSR